MRPKVVDVGRAEEDLPAIAAAPSRNFFVDLLRGLSITIVMCLHLKLPSWADVAAPQRVKLAINSGYYGVTVFFVVSGYLIAMTSIRRFRSLADIDLGRFAKFRFGRIVPLLGLVLASLIALGLSGASGFVFPKAESMLDATTSVLSLRFNDYYVKYHGWQTDPWNVMWSLSIEELFYVFLPIVCRVLRTKTMTVAWLMFSVPFSMYARTESFGLYAFSGCVDALSIGVLTAILAEERRSRNNVFWAASGMLLGLATIFYVCQLEPPTSNPRWGPLVCALGAGVFIYSSLHVPARLMGVGVRRSPAGLLAAAVGSPLILLSLLGRYSYEAYLLHFPVHRFVTRYLWPSCDSIVLMVLIGVAAYLVNTHFTEPMNRLIRDDHRREHLRAARGRQLHRPLLVALVLVAVPLVIVQRDRRHPKSVVSVFTNVIRSKIDATVVPLIAYGESGDAEFVSVKKGADGSVQLQFDHWGLPPLTKAIDPRLLKDTFTVELDFGTPAVRVQGVPFWTRADLIGFSPHTELAIGRNDIGGGTTAVKADGQIASWSITFNNGLISGESTWRRGE